MKRVISALLITVALFGGGVRCEPAPPEARAVPERATPAPEPAAPAPRAPADLDALPPGAVARLGTRAFAHAEPLLAAVWAGDRVVTASQSELRIWEAHAGWLIQRIETPIAQLAVARDGTTFATSPADSREVRLWRAGESGPRETVQAGQRHVTALAFSLDGSTLAAASTVGEIRLFSVEEGVEAGALDLGSRWPAALAFAPSGERLAVGSRDGVVQVFEGGAGEPVLTFDAPAERVAALAFSSSGDLLAVGTLGGLTVGLYDAHTGATWATLEGHQGGVTGLAFAAGDDTLVSLGLDRALWRWSVDGGRPVGPPLTPWDAGGPVRFTPGPGVEAPEIRPFLSVAPDGSEALVAGWGEAFVRASLTEGRVETRLGPTGAVRSLAFADGGQTLLAGADDGTISVWRPATGERAQVLRGHRGPVIGLEVEGAELRSRSGWTVRTWDLAAGTQRAVEGGRFAALGALSFDPGGDLVLGDFGRVLRVDPRSGLESRVLETDPRSFVTLGHTVAGETLAVGRSSLGDALYEVGTGRRRRSLDMLDDHRNVVLSADGTTLAGVARSGEVTVWRLDREEPVMSFAPRRRVEYVALSPDGSWLAGGGRGDLDIWEVGGGSTRMPTYAGHVMSLVWSADGRCVGAAGTHQVMSYELASGLSPVRVHEAADAVALSSDCERVAALLPDGRIQIWRPAEPEPDFELGEEGTAGQGMASASPALAFSSDDGLLAVADRFNQVSVWDLEARERVLQLGDGTVPRAEPPEVAISPDGRLEARVDAMGHIEVLDVSGDLPAVLAELEGHGAPVTALTFSPDGGVLATGSADTTILLWAVGVE